MSVLKTFCPMCDVCDHLVDYVRVSYDPVTQNYDFVLECHGQKEFWTLTPIDWRERIPFRATAFMRVENQAVCAPLIRAALSPEIGQNDNNDVSYFQL